MAFVTLTCDKYVQYCTIVNTDKRRCYVSQDVDIIHYVPDCDELILPKTVGLISDNAGIKKECVISISEFDQLKRIFNKKMYSEQAEYYTFRIGLNIYIKVHDLIRF